MAMIIGTDAGERLDGTTEAETLWGGGGNDTVYGDGYAPGIPGNGQGPATYLGGGDVLLGADGDARLSGGHGADMLVGGAGADVFSFGTHIPFNTNAVTPGIFVLDSGVGAGARDMVLDFTQGEDVIDLSLLLNLAHRHLDIDESYQFIGTAEFTGERAQVRYAVEDGRTVVQLDGTEFLSGAVRGVDRVADAEIELVGAFALTADNFIL
jgi:Ca2+-binding RTX toxin-like protein